MAECVCKFDSFIRGQKAKFDNHNCVSKLTESQNEMSRVTSEGTLSKRTVITPATVFQTSHTHTHMKVLKTDNKRLS